MAKLQSFLDSVDLYGAQANKFSYKTREYVHSTTGLGFSMMHWVLMLAFAAIKFLFVANNYNPNIAIYSNYDIH
jgi:hypothetical protein